MTPERVSDDVPTGVESQNYESVWGIVSKKNPYSLISVISGLSDLVSECLNKNGAQKTLH